MLATSAVVALPAAVTWCRTSPFSALAAWAAIVAGGLARPALAAAGWPSPPLEIALGPLALMLAVWTRGWWSRPRLRPVVIGWACAEAALLIGSGMRGSQLIQLAAATLYPSAVAGACLAAWRSLQWRRRWTTSP